MLSRLIPGVCRIEELLDRSASGDVSGGASLARRFSVACFNLLDGPEHAVDYLGVHGQVFHGVPHPYFPAATVVRVSADPDGDEPGSYVVTAQYQEPRLTPGQPRQAPGQGPGRPGNPTPENRGSQVSVSFRTRETHYATDLDGKLIRNSCGDPFEAAPPFADTALTIRYTAWYPEWSVFLAALFFNKVNSDHWNGFPPHSLKVSDIDGKPKAERNWTGWEVTYTFEYEPLPESPAPGQTGGWHPVAILDQGWNVRVPAPAEPEDEPAPPEEEPPPEDPVDPGVEPPPEPPAPAPAEPELVKQAAKDRFGEPLSSPVMLNGVDGREARRNLDGTITPKYLYFKYYDEISFAEF